MRFNSTLRIATRKSILAIWQANFVKNQLLAHDSSLKIDLVLISTEGDRKLDESLSKSGGKGLFVKELEQALLANQADIAVHSMKDMPVQLPNELIIAACLTRGNPQDAFLSPNYSSIETLPRGAVIGTSSLRRQSQLLALRPDVQVMPLRGNVDTRLKKLMNNEFDGIILACAGLQRLGMDSYIQEILAADRFLPAIGQGIIGVECRNNDSEIKALLSFIHHHETEVCLRAERAMNQQLQGGCQAPIAGFARVENSKLILSGKVLAVDGSQVLKAQGSASLEQAEWLGTQVAESLLLQGARELIEEAIRNG